MKCFFCGRPYVTDTNEDGQVRLRCAFPRCKMNPTTDFHDNEVQCYADIDLIKESWRNSR